MGPRIFVYTVLGIIAVAAESCRPPTIISGAMERRWFTELEYLNIPCVATGDGTLTYTWTKNNLPYNLTNDFRGRVSMLPGMGTLFLQDASEEDIGFYQCHVANNCGTALNQGTQLIIGRMEPGQIFLSPRRYRVMVGSHAVLSCESPPSTPQVQVTWHLKYQQDEDSWPQFTQVELDDRITMDDEGNLYITNVQREDEQDGKSYVCIAANPIVRMMTTGQDSLIDVVGPPDGLHHPASIMYHSPTETVAMAGRTATLKCIFAGNPEPTTTWEKVGGELNDARTTVGHHQLTIDNVQAGDAGSYRCSGGNGLTTHAVDHVFTIRVVAKPQWTNQPSDTTVAPGETATFDCRAAGNPEPTVQWFINGEPLADLQNDPRRHLADNVLTFTQLRTEDSLVVQCNASNTHGYAWADTYLYVEG